MSLISRMPRGALVGAVFLAGALTGAAGVAISKDAASQPSKAPAQAIVVHVDAAPKKTAPSGKAEVRLLAHGQEAFLGRLSMQAGGKVPTHRDATEEFIYVLEGSGTLTIDGQKHAIKPGTSIYMPANAEVSYQNGDAAFTALQVFAGPGPAAKYDAWR